MRSSVEGDGHYAEEKAARAAAISRYSPLLSINLSSLLSTVSRFIFIAAFLIFFVKKNKKHFKSFCVFTRVLQTFG